MRRRRSGPRATDPHQLTDREVIIVARLLSSLSMDLMTAPESVMREAFMAEASRLRANGDRS